MPFAYLRVRGPLPYPGSALSLSLFGMKEQALGCNNFRESPSVNRPPSGPSSVAVEWMREHSCRSLPICRLPITNPLMAGPNYFRIADQSGRSSPMVPITPHLLLHARIAGGKDGSC